MKYLQPIFDWLLSLGETYHVNPFLFAGIYLTSKLFFFFFLGWVLKNLRAKRPFTLQLVIAAISFSLPYLYIIIAGRNISVWVYIFIGCVYAYGAFSMWKQVRTVR